MVGRRNGRIRGKGAANMFTDLGGPVRGGQSLLAVADPEVVDGSIAGVGRDMGTVDLRIQVQGIEKRREEKMDEEVVTGQLGVKVGIYIYIYVCVCVCVCVRACVSDSAVGQVPDPDREVTMTILPVDPDPIWRGRVGATRQPDRDWRTVAGVDPCVRRAWDLVGRKRTPPSGTSDPNAPVNDPNPSCSCPTSAPRRSSNTISRP